MTCLPSYGGCFDPMDMDRDVNGDDGSDESNSMVSFTRSHSTQSDTLDCDYRSVTPLFKAIEQENWQAVLTFLTTGKWSSSPLRSSLSHLHSPSASIQTRTWVTSSSRNGEIEWSQLPLHAALTYMAPLPVIQKLVELHPNGVRSADDTGNLPLHLAFGFGLPDNVVLFLLNEFPQALHLRGLQGRFPVDCSDLGTMKTRGQVIQICQRQAREHQKEQMYRNWRKLLSDSIQKADDGFQHSETAYQMEKLTLEEVIMDYVDAKKKLEKIKKSGRKGRPSKIKADEEELRDRASSPSSTTRSTRSIRPTRSTTSSIKIAGFAAGGGESSASPTSHNKYSPKNFMYSPRKRNNGQNGQNDTEDGTTATASLEGSNSTHELQTKKSGLGKVKNIVRALPWSMSKREQRDDDPFE